MNKQSIEQKNHIVFTVHPRRLIAACFAVVALSMIFLWQSSRQFSQSAPLPEAKVITGSSKDTPAWAREIPESILGEWKNIQLEFAFSDTKIEHVMHILKATKRFSPSHPLYDLTNAPTEVSRAFRLISIDKIGKVKEKLIPIAAADAPFPDQKYFPKDTLNNLRVYAVIERLDDLKADSRVKDIHQSLLQLRHEQPKS